MAGRPSVSATPVALATISRLTAELGPLVFLQSGECCDGSSPLCMRKGELLVGAGDSFSLEGRHDVHFLLAAPGEIDPIRPVPSGS